MSDAEPITPEDEAIPDAGAGAAIDSIEVQQLRRGRWLGQLQVYYQPIIDVRDGSLVGMEALLRWQHPQRGTLPARNFVPMAERSGMTGHLDGEVLRTASAFRRRLAIDDGIGFKVTVNVVAADLVETGAVGGIRGALEETRLPPELLQIEVSNLAGVEDRAALKAVIEELRGYGVSLSLDDFETASASRHVLAELPFQTVKVDFNEAQTPEAIQAMIEAVGAARGRGLDVVAKRVETADHLRLLRRLDIQSAQGYVLGSPARASEFEELLRDARLLPNSAEGAYAIGHADAA